jgi:hypothetical protein
MLNFCRKVSFDVDEGFEHCWKELVMEVQHSQKKKKRSIEEDAKMYH